MRLLFYIFVAIPFYKVNNKTLTLQIFVLLLSSKIIFTDLLW